MAFFISYFLNIFILSWFCHEFVFNYFYILYRNHTLMDEKDAQENIITQIQRLIMLKH